MPAAALQNVMCQIRRVVSRPLNADTSDHDLLVRFLQEREEDAFAALVRRHGPMIMGVCLRLLNHRQDAEDAFQATFLMLVRKGHTIRQRDALASWLHRVAFRIALRARASASKLPAATATSDVAVETDPVADAAWRELRPVLDVELQRLPMKYRTPMTLCYLEGKTYEEAATMLGCPKGTVAIRLLRGRQMLKNRLVRRGLVLSAGWLAAQAAFGQASAAVPIALAKAIINAAAATAQGLPAAVTMPASVAVLLQSVTRSAWIQKVAVAAVICLGTTIIGAGIGISKSTSSPAVAFAEKIERTGEQPLPAVSRDEAKTPVNLAESSKPLNNVCEPPFAGCFQPPELQCHEFEGAAYIFPKSHRHNGRSMTVVVFRPTRAASGLAIRSELTDDGCSEKNHAAGTSPRRTDAVATERTTASKGPTYRLIIVTEKTRFSSIPGCTKVIVLAPVSLIEIYGDGEHVWLR